MSDLLKLVKDKTIKGFVSRLLHSRNQIHIFHLQVTGKGSYAIHIALGGYYDSIGDIIDTIVESYQSKYGIITGYVCDDYANFTSKEEVIKYLEDLHQYVDDNRLNIFKDSDLLNEVDTIKTLIKSTLYKLKYLE